MLTASVDYRTTIDGVDYTVAGELTITLPASPYVDFTRALQTVNLSAQMTTDLPDTVRVQDGLSVVSGDITIGGSVDPHGDETKTAAWLFNPDSPDSPLRHLTVNGCEIIYRDGLYVTGSATPEMNRLGTLYINGYDIDHQAGTVTFHVTELDEAWLTTPNLAAVVTVPPYNAGLTSEFPMDQVIRSVYGASTWPAQRAQPILSVGMRSSLWPEVGTLDTTYPQLPPTFAPGAWGTAYAGNQPATDLSGSYWVGPAYGLDTSTWPLTTKLAFEATVTGIGSAVGLNASFRYGVPFALFHLPGRPFLYSVVGLTVDIDDTGINVATTAGSDFWTVTLDATPHTLLFWASVSGGTITCHAQVDGGAVHNFAGVTFTDDMSTWTNAMLFTAGDATVEAWQTTTETAPATSYPFTPKAVLDQSLNPLTAVPAIAKDTKAWEILQTIVSAELGYIRKDANGVIRFTNRRTILGGPVCRPITSKISLKKLGTGVPPAGSSRTITVPYTDWDFGSRTAVWTLASKKLIRPNRTVTWQQAIPDGVLAAAIDGTVSLLPDNHAADDGNSWYRASLDPDGVNAHPGLHITAKILSPGLLQISARNTTAQGAYLVSPSTYTDAGYPGRLGQPSLWIGGVPATPAAEATVSVTYADGRGETPVASNSYLQDHDTAVDVGNWLLNQLYMDVRDFTDVSIVPDGTIEIADINPLRDPDASSVDEYVLIWGWSFSADFPPAGTAGGSRDMSLNVRALGPLDAPLGGAITDRFEVGTAWSYA
jgi:hypothetical protein